MIIRNFPIHCYRSILLKQFRKEVSQLIMKRWIYKLGSALVVLFGITFLSFLLTYISPGDPASMMLKKSGMAVSKEAVEAKREELGLNDPMLIQYGNWVRKVLKGNLGESYKSGRPVFTELQNTLPATIQLAVLAMAMIILISTPAGIWCAYKPNRLGDNLFRAFSYLLSSLPSFFVALVFMYYFCLRMKMFPVISKGNKIGVVLPAIVLAVTLSAWYIRQVRAIALAELSKDYIQGLRSRGVAEYRILINHVLRNCMLPFVTLFGLSAGSLLGGATIIESIFTWPGVGKLAVDAIISRDYPIIQGYVLWMAVIFLVINALIDFSYSIFDPRLRRGNEK